MNEEEKKPDVQIIQLSNWFAEPWIPGTLDGHYDVAEVIIKDGILTLKLVRRPDMEAK